MRKPVVSRTITTTPLLIMCADVEKQEIVYLDYKAVGKYEKETPSLTRELTAGCLVAGYKYISVTNFGEPEAKTYSLPIDRFIAYADALEEEEAEAEAEAMNADKEVTENEQ